MSIVEYTIMSSSIANPEGFLRSFKDAGGWYDPGIFDIAEFDKMGWGGVALKDIEVCPPRQSDWNTIKTDGCRNIHHYFISHWRTF